MAETLTSIKARVASLLQDKAGLLSTGTGGDVEASIRDAIEQLSADKPALLVADLTGDGTTFDFDLPAGFVYGDSGIVSIEYPVVNLTMSRVPVLLTDDDWTYYRTASTTKLRFMVFTPGVGELARVTYTGQHTLDGLDSAAATTVPTWLTQAFVMLCTAKALLRLADRFLHEQEDTYNLDTVERAGRSDMARRLANAFLAQYAEQVGTAQGEAPGFTLLTWPSEAEGISRFSGLTHRRRTGP